MRPLPRHASHSSGWTPVPGVLAAAPPCLAVASTLGSAHGRGLSSTRTQALHSAHARTTACAAAETCPAAAHAVPTPHPLICAHRWITHVEHSLLHQIPSQTLLGVAKSTNAGELPAAHRRG